MKKLVLIILLLAGSLPAQTLWGVNTDSISLAENWPSQKDYNGKPLYSRENVGDFDYVSCNEFGFLFYRENPPDYMYQEVYAYLKNIFGKEHTSRDYTPKLSYDIETSKKVRFGKWKYDKEWNLGDKLVNLVWKEYKLYVNCLYYR